MTATATCHAALRQTALSPRTRDLLGRSLFGYYWPQRHCTATTRRSYSSNNDGVDQAALSNKEPLSALVPRLDQYALAPPPPDYLTLRKGQRVVAIGDVHGDFEALVDFLLVARVLDPASAEPVWTGGDTICIQIGDVLDRGDDELACLRLLASLSRQASKEGGALTLLYGNHEPLNAVGIFHYANKGGNEEYERDIGTLIDQELGGDEWRLQFAGHEPARWASLEPGGLLADPLLSNMKVAIVVGRTVFVHAGLTAKHLREYGGLTGMNEAARDWILKSHGENENMGHFDSTDEVIASAQERAQKASSNMPHCLGGGVGEESPVWMRDYSSPCDALPENYEHAQEMIDEALEELGNDVQRMVMGHTPQRHINSVLGGKAWRIDVGASRGIMGGSPEVLEIVHGGDNKEDVVTILTKSGSFPSSDRQVGEPPSDSSSNHLLGSLFRRDDK